MGQPPTVPGVCAPAGERTPPSSLRSAYPTAQARPGAAVAIHHGGETERVAAAVGTDGHDVAGAVPAERPAPGGADPLRRGERHGHDPVGGAACVDRAVVAVAPDCA